MGLLQQSCIKSQTMFCLFLQAHNTIIDLQKLEETLSQELQLRIRFARFTSYISTLIRDPRTRGESRRKKGNAFAP